MIINGNYSNIVVIVIIAVITIIGYQNNFSISVPQIYCSVSVNMVTYEIACVP